AAVNHFQSTLKKHIGEQGWIIGKGRGNKDGWIKKQEEQGDDFTGGRYRNRSGSGRQPVQGNAWGGGGPLPWSETATRYWNS
ncbi:MAG: hypothetical protein D3925_16790, partial [Candidatus Electrothrix sp. AR5]|nr:hypothetical protein [Candidatus Electrothrix sp. AR5]